MRDGPGTAARMARHRGVPRCTGPDVDELLHRGLMQEHRGAWRMVAPVLASQGALRPGLTEQEAGDLAAAVTRPEIYLILSGELSWSPTGSLKS